MIKCFLKRLLHNLKSNCSNQGDKPRAPLQAVPQPLQWRNTSNSEAGAQSPSCQCIISTSSEQKQDFDVSQLFVPGSRASLAPVSPPLKPLFLLLLLSSLYASSFSFILLIHLPLPHLHLFILVLPFRSHFILHFFSYSRSPCSPYHYHTISLFSISCLSYPLLPLSTSPSFLFPLD